MSQETSKGGLVGLPEDDFIQRQKSGLWSLEDLAAQKNQINNSNQPNTLLAIGQYYTTNLYLYNLFNKSLSKLNTVSTSSIRNISYNYNNSLLAISTPYLKLLNTDTLIEYNTLSIQSSIINTLSFNNTGNYLYLGLLNKNISNTYIQVINIEKQLNTSNIYPDININLNYLPTKIKFNNTDEYLCIGHYGSIEDEFNNIHLYRDINDEYIDITDYTLKNLKLGTITDLCFVDSLSLLFIASFQKPYLNVYDFERQDLVTTFDREIENNITSKINSFVLTKNGDKLLIGCDLSPYFFILDLVYNKISTPDTPVTDSTITSLSLSHNDQYLCITDKSSTPLKVFTYIDQILEPVEIDTLVQPEQPILTSAFFFGPQGVSVDIF